MAINFGTDGNNNFTVTHADGYEEYRGLGGDDVYNVNPNLTEAVKISDSRGADKVVLGAAEITSSRFFSGGAEFTYATGGKLTVLGDMSSIEFVFGGGSDPFAPVEGGVLKTFEDTVTAFNVDPSGLSPTTPVEGGGVIIESDGTVQQSSGEEGISMVAGGNYTATGEDDIFLYDFSDYSGGNYGDISMVGLDGAVTIEGFDPDHDIIRFVDQDGTPPTLTQFQTSGYQVTPNAFDPVQTVVSLVPWMGEDGTVSPVGSADVILAGVVTETVQIEVV
ncbi:hypothetical protein MTBBW1_2200008 [Desulfamplus magnetovallimortis]|uniref:Uncharacterized protein n=1 Tax=Desulfamplus magnetovallimortis TaxID=1246637 RepID=A0A1W1HCY2_9BACT|nr:hypothetical protein [Desulfamplus magnetovallimortis]SLM30354.1 hypothetical protein MTBBW1_2200008 [Desulfamplus magnetovallimortis]